MDDQRAKQQAIDDSTKGMLGEQANAASKTERGTVAATFSSAALSYLGGTQQTEQVQVAKSQLQVLRELLKEQREDRSRNRAWDAIVWTE
jgi:hypothetical protein